MDRDKVIVSKQKLLLKEMFDVAILKEQLALLMDINSLVLEDQKVRVNYTSD